jgi:TolA-binding protein
LFSLARAMPRFYFRGMKPTCFFVLALCASTLLRSHGQDTNAAALERRNAEERYRILSDKIGNIEETQNTLLKRHQRLQDQIETLASDIRKIKEDYARGSINLVTSDQLKSLVDKLQEVDRKREADKELFLKSFRDLAKLPPPQGQASEGSAPKQTTPGEAPEGYWTYKVKKDDTLTAILAGYNTEVEAQGFERVTLDRLRDANPKLRTRNYPLEGETLKIPMFSKKKKNK